MTADEFNSSLKFCTEYTAPESCVFRQAVRFIAIIQTLLCLGAPSVSAKTQSLQISRICPVPGANRAEMDVGGADLRSSIKKWKIIYPVYLNSKKTVAEGRRIAAAKACPDPTCIEIADSCAFLKIPRAIELDKAYPRDFFQVGRVRVQLTNDDGSPVNPAIRTKKQLMIQIAELVPKHHGRTKKQEPAAGPSVVSSNNKKKNKNKK
ncbi:signal recognition particle 19 kDa protein isoform X1 [Lolium perenne]|uniref:signal recognition particle 19 kDa protein isoform X1 n=2 Tax=Lolium perenne TaxID=4522 RepID=UPI0021F5209A|nr:signal recognition particle 19 kDa protein-like isoform X1 [Lolium perenne]